MMRGGWVVMRGGVGGDDEGWGGWVVRTTGGV